jgi:DNA-binding LytR/AlgR family response regulator
MAHVDGFTAAERIRRVDPDVVMIFVTHMDQLATRGYEVDALAYVVKPVNYFSLARVLDRAIKRVQARDEQNVMLAVDGDLVKVRARDVIFLESARNRTIVQALDARYSVVGPLKQFETQLADMPFFRSNSGYLVNLGHVLGMRGADAVMTGGYELRVSRPRRSEFLAALTAYLSSRRA